MQIKPGSVIGAIIILLLAYWALPSNEDDARINRARASLDQEVQLQQQMSADRSGGEIMGFASSMNLKRVIAQESAPTPEALRAHYKLYYRYPKNSRPLTKSMVDLLDPMKMQTSTLPLYKKGEDIKGPPSYQFQFNSPSHSITGSQLFIASLEVRNIAEGVAVRPDIKSAKVYSDFASGRQLLNEAEFNDSGFDEDARADDNIFTFSWRAGGKDRKYWGDLEMRVIFEIESEEYEASLGFFHSPEMVAEFLGVFDEYMKDGSLTIAPQIDIKKGGHFIIEANLFHEETEEPVGWAYFNGELNPGVQQTPLIFFGRIFHDLALDGKFVLRNLRGFRNNIPFKLSDMQKVAEQGLDKMGIETKDEPDKEMIANYDQDYTTQEYKLEQFSKQEYQGADKEKALSMANAG